MELNRIHLARCTSAVGVAFEQERTTPPGVASLSTTVEVRADVRRETADTVRTGPGRHEDPEVGLGRTRPVEMGAEATHAGCENRKLDAGRLRRLAVHDELPIAGAPAVLEEVEEEKTPDPEKTTGGGEGEGEAENTVEVAAEARRSAAFARRCRRMVGADGKAREEVEELREEEIEAENARSSTRRPARAPGSGLAAVVVDRGRPE
jgi:hypothetical protein